MPLNLKYPTHMRSVHISAYFILSEHLVRLLIREVIKAFKGCFGAIHCIYLPKVFTTCFQVGAKTLNIKESLHYTVLFCSARWNTQQSTWFCSPQRCEFYCHSQRAWFDFRDYCLAETKQGMFCLLHGTKIFAPDFGSCFRSACKLVLIAFGGKKLSRMKYLGVESLIME